MNLTLVNGDFRTSDPSAPRADAVVIRDGGGIRDERSVWREPWTLEITRHGRLAACFEVADD